ncbi:FG-GAP repeat domain-containing protein [Virgibacillus ndiopensis]|uniref:FG-GAP repeat domain-containing protein n=1 Tax=Virgibacillus ndiopensis TaxID=2004408 RepID=UPI000C07F274|nr:VCBS repeat-containing protein [Virgibacillus ndiopensis]
MKYLVSCLLVLLTLHLNLTFTVFAEEKENPVEKLIATYKEDVTGDGLKEVINLYGVIFSKNSNYLHNTWATIKGPGKMQWKITYKGGYEPKLQFVDIDHDGVKDIFYQSATGGSGGLYYYHLHTLKKENVKELPLPKSNYIHGEFQKEFKAALSIEPWNNPIIIDVKDRADEYIQQGIYDKNGKLIKKISLMVDPIAFFEPTLFNKSKGYGLKSYQQISGAYHADQLGSIESLWYFEDGKWIKIKAQWIPSGQKNS